MHTIYQSAGFSYPYARSSDLYNGTENFQRVDDPQPGDLVVWRGHVGIVVNPVQHAFFSSMRSGLGVDEYKHHTGRSAGAYDFIAMSLLFLCARRPPANSCLNGPKSTRKAKTSFDDLDDFCHPGTNSFQRLGIFH